jgi:hypothetical protein
LGKPHVPSVLLIFLIFLFRLSLLCLAGCERGCARGWIDGRRGGESPPPPTLNAVDCPDGLAKCEDGVVSASRLAQIPLPCTGPPPACVCPWERVEDCAFGCAAEGVEVILDRRGVASQLCAPGPDAGAVARAGRAPYDGPPCEEGQRYGCVGDVVLECSSAAVAIGRCLRGCYADGGRVDDDSVSREAAFAILCSR